MKKSIHKIISSHVTIQSTPEIVWEKITNVEIEHFKFPWYFRLLNIPKPIKAEITQKGVGGKRIAYFDNGKKFFQDIDSWEQNRTYSFTFDPEDGFKAGYFFSIFDGVFKILKGTYFLKTSEKEVQIQLKTNYSIQRNYLFALHYPILVVLSVFQKYLLNTIKVNAENEKTMFSSLVEK